MSVYAGDAFKIGTFGSVQMFWLVCLVGFVISILLIWLWLEALQIFDSDNIREDGVRYEKSNKWPKFPTVNSHNKL